MLSQKYVEINLKANISGENGYLAGIQKDAVHVNVTTITPDAADQLEKLHEQHGAHYVSGTVCILFGFREGEYDI